MDPAAPAQVNTMSSNTVKVDGLEVASDSSKPMVINITINQPSSQSCLLESVKHLGTILKSLKNDVISRVKTNVMPPMSTVMSVKQGLEVARIVIGMASVALGIVLSAEHQTRTSQKGTPFWTGVPFILSGILSLVREKTTSRFWRWTASLMNLASLVVAIAGIAVIADDINAWPWENYAWNPYDLCHPQRNNGYNGYNGYNRGYQRTTTPYQYEDSYREERCNDVTGRLLSILRGVRILLLLIAISGMISSLYSVGCDLWALCCTSLPGQEEEEATVEDDVEPLLPSLLPPAYSEKQRNVEIV